MKRSNDYYRSLDRAKKKWKPRRGWSFHHFTYLVFCRQSLSITGLSIKRVKAYRQRISEYLRGFLQKGVFQL